MKKLKEKFKGKKKPFIVAILVLCVGGGAVFFVTHKTANASDTYATGTPVVQVAKQDLTKTISVSGTINSAETYNVSSEITNVLIKEINVKVGDQVHAGDVLATLDTTTLEKDLKSAQTAAGITSQQNNLSIAEAERNYNSTVASNDTAVNRSSAALTDAKNSQTTANNKLNEANNAYNAAATMLDAKNQALNSAQTIYEAAKADYQADPTDATKKATYEQAEKDLENAQEEVKAAESAVAEAKATQVAAQEGVTAANSGVTSAQQALDDANTTRAKSNADGADAVTSSKLSAQSSAQSANDSVNKAKEQISKATLVAPADGIVTAVNAKAGDVYSGTTMIVIQDTSGYKVTANLDEYDISDAVMGQKATIMTDTTGDTEMKGSLTFVSPTPAAAVANSDGSTSTTTGYPIEITIENPSERLRIGMKAKVTIVVDTVKDVLAVPSSAIQQDDDGSFFVEVAEDADKDGYADGEDFQKVAVTQGLATDYLIEVSGKDLKEGLYVVIPTDEVSMDDINAGLF